jgi:hypothetical protein
MRLLLCGRQFFNPQTIRKQPANIPPGTSSSGHYGKWPDPAYCMRLTCGSDNWALRHPTCDWATRGLFNNPPFTTGDTWAADNNVLAERTALCSQLALRYAMNPQSC